MSANLTFLKWYYDGDDTDLSINQNNLKNGDFYVTKITNANNIISIYPKTMNKSIVQSLPNLNSPKRKTNSSEEKAPIKPTRVPTIKLDKKPDYLVQKELKLNEKEIDFDGDEKLGSRQRLNLDNYTDVNPPNLNLKSLIDLSQYECGGLIKDSSKHLDRFALIDIKQTLLVELKSVLQNAETMHFASHLAKCFTYNDIQLLRFNIDFGLGVNNGIELVTLPNGDIIRKDIVERHKTSSLFLVLIVLLCQNIDERIEMIVNLLDCALYLFEKLKNLFAFCYFMEALNNKHIKRLSQTWSYLEEKNLVKSNLFKNLNEKYSNLIRGQFFHVEQKALIPNIYPVALLLLNDQNDLIDNNHSLNDDYNFYSNLIDIYLSINAKYLTQNVIKYASECESFVESEYTLLFSNKSNSNKLPPPPATTTTSTKLIKKLFAISEIEFEQIILWSDNFERNYYTTTNKANGNKPLAWSNLLNEKIKHSTHILAILSLKSQSISSMDSSQ